MCWNLILGSCKHKFKMFQFNIIISVFGCCINTIFYMNKVVFQNLLESLGKQN